MLDNIKIRYIEIVVKNSLIGNYDDFVPQAYALNAADQIEIDLDVKGLLSWIDGDLLTERTAINFAENEILKSNILCRKLLQVKVH